ncbi:hypothetical protein QNH48_15335 [Neobacillus sp. YX16]|uniref:hypothetical protein n=1 Tax=Neobacillus sp. YX16 TaxID=3047874 RepID=UPI0024C37BDD|nr:hypothetical protein [Neobacillus sp. YX16]WHZ00453.1 hypothetical protein QNH48_15335 [Neobacillus sp. YX16]
MDRIRYNQLKAFVQLDYKGRHDDIPQFHFHREDLKWLFEMAEKAESYERSLRTIAQDMNGKESTELIEFAGKALRN